MLLKVFAKRINEMTRLRVLLVAGVAVLGLAGCSGSDTLPGGGADGDIFGSGGAGDGSSITTSGEGGNGRIGEFAQDVPQDLLGNLVVYFEFDRSEIRADFNDMLAAHGRYLASNPNAHVRLEGHADERGSREYNVGLGERRALAVRQILLLQGATSSQVSTVSYGEERPAVFGSDEESYGLNRRVEIVYQ
jgi:peptidoglycan-associated lipoprotein